MEKLLRMFFFVFAIVVAFVIGIYTATWFAVEIRIPPAVIGTCVGLLAFVVVIVVLEYFFSTALDLMLFKGCRSLFWDIAKETWCDWKLVIPSIVVGIVGWIPFSPWTALAAAALTYVLMFVSAYIYFRTKTESAVGLSYRE